MITVPCRTFMSLLNHTSHSGSRGVTAAASRGRAASQSSSTSASPVRSESGASLPLKQPTAGVACLQHRVGAQPTPVWPSVQGSITHGAARSPQTNLVWIFIRLADKLSPTWPPRAIMLTHNVLAGRDECSKQERISVLYAYFESFWSNTYTTKSIETCCTVYNMLSGI